MSENSKKPKSRIGRRSMSRGKKTQEIKRRNAKDLSVESSKGESSKRKKALGNKILKEQFNNLRKQLQEYDEGDEEGEEEEEGDVDLDPRSIQAVKYWYQKKLKSRKSVSKPQEYF